MDSDPASFIRPKRRISLERDAWGRLVLAWPDGRRQVGVRAVRGFPLTAPHEGIALCDEEGTELVWVADLYSVCDDVRRRLQEELARSEFVPVVERILQVSAGAEATEWEVQTDRGRVQFALRGDDDVRRLGDGRALIVDIHGIRYLVPDARSLDPTSRRTLERYLC